MASMGVESGVETDSIRRVIITLRRSQRVTRTVTSRIFFYGVVLLGLDARNAVRGRGLLLGGLSCVLR